MKLKFRLNVLLLKFKFKNIFMNKTSIVCNTQRWRFIFTNIMYSNIFTMHQYTYMAFQYLQYTEYPCWNEEDKSVYT